jgi:hypothetical protein
MLVMAKECMKSQKNERMVFLYRKPKSDAEAVKEQNDGKDAG